MDPHLMCWLFACKFTLILLVATSESSAQSCVFIACSCNTDQNGLSVNCSSKGLSSLPSPTSTANIYELNINNNNITSLPENIFSGLNIIKLNLGDNPISSVHNNTFESLGSSLKILILSGNSATAPPKDALVKLVQLEALTLTNYNLPDLSDSNAPFNSMTNLKNLTLDKWNLVSISERAFRISGGVLKNLVILNQPMDSLQVSTLHSGDLDSLEKLQFSFMLINNVGHKAFERFTKIKEIDLSSNFIHTLDSESFSGAGNVLVRLSLSNNSLTSDTITNILTGLKNLQNLQELDLSFNSLTTVPDLSQIGITKPLNLYLNANKFNTLTSNSFQGIANNLRLLNLSDNDISTLDTDMFAGVTGLEVFYFSRRRELTRTPLILPASLTLSERTLKELYLDGQDLDFSELWLLIQQFTKLEVLSLSSTQLTFIPDMALIYFPNLRTLDLSLNNLNSITQPALAGPHSSLQLLSLTGNTPPIKQMPFCIFYQYTSFPITLAMGGSSLTCNCSILWLWNQTNSANIKFITGQEAVCEDGNPLATKKKEELCNEQYTNPTCPDLYSKNLTMTLELSGLSVVVSWQLSDLRGLKLYTLKVISTKVQTPVVSTNLTVSSLSYTVNNLENKTYYEFCVTAFFETSVPITKCSTMLYPGQDNNKDQQSDKSNETAIIIGVVVGVVVLIAIVAVIAYLIFFYRKRKEKEPKNVPEQPRNFSKSELPSMNEETRTFSKPPRPRENGIPERREGMQVVAISDGHVPNLRVGRALMINPDGSFRTSSKPSSTSSYENDRGPLPPIPTRPHSESKPAGYYNMGFRDDKYDEIGQGGKESRV